MCHFKRRWYQLRAHRAGEEVISKALLRNILDAALGADLEKNEWRVFAALLRQTIGYGKQSDPLTMGRLAHLTGIRKDRINKAASGVVGKGIFSASEHKWLDFTYSVPDGFFDGEVESRFFAPSAPFSGNETRSMGEFNHSAGTYRDTHLQSHNHNTDSATPEPEQSVCAVSENPVKEEIKPLAKPEAVDDTAYIKLLPALKTLPNSQAVDVLKLLEAAILDGSIKTTQERMGGGLIKAARQGTLNTALLEERRKAAIDRKEHQRREEARIARESAADRAYLERMAKLAGVPVSMLMPKGGAG